MRAAHLFAVCFVLVTPAIAHAADLVTERRVVSSEAEVYNRDRIYRIRGAYQDSGWAYEVPVYRDCQVRIIQTPYGIDRIRRCD